jgi:hypothetical protein
MFAPPQVMLWSLENLADITKLKLPTGTAEKRLAQELLVGDVAHVKNISDVMQRKTPTQKILN